MKTIGIVSLGCPRNQVDSEIIAFNLRSKGIKITDPYKADGVIINTCSFITEAKQETIDTIREFVDIKNKRKKFKVIVSGCFVRHYGLSIPKYLKGIDALVDVLSFDNKYLPRVNLSLKHFAYLKISEGCLHKCSYCVIPNLKGSLKSRTYENILEEVRILDSQNIKELYLIGQDTTSWGRDFKDKSKDISFLLEKVHNSAKNIKWIRLMYLHPNFIDERLIKTIAALPKVCNYIDIPLQHVNDRILKMMNRNFTYKKTLMLMDKLKKNIPSVAIRTSMIVGFPTETDKEFKQLLNFVKDQKFTNLGAFKYSREKGTKAFDFPQVHAKTKQKRFNQLMSLQREVSYKNNLDFIGQNIEVLVDEYRDGISFARRYSDAYDIDGQVLVKGKFSVGEFLKVRVSGSHEYDLEAERVQ